MRKAIFRYIACSGEPASYQEHAGCVVDTALLHDEYVPVYRINAEDGWNGVAWESELEFIHN